MKRKLVLSGSALLSLLCVAGVQAEEGGVSGHVEATGKSIDVSGNKANRIAFDNCRFYFSRDL